MHTLSQNALTAVGFAPAAFTNGTQAGTSVDTNQSSSGPYRRACVLVQLNTGSATTGNFLVKDSPDNSTFTTIPGATLGAAQAASTSGVYMVDVDVAKHNRYLRVDIVGTGTAGAASAEIVLFEGATLAPTQAQTPILV